MRVQRYSFLVSLAIAMIVIMPTALPAWLRNLAMLKLEPLWATQRLIAFDPPCVGKEIADIEFYLETNVTSAPASHTALTNIGRALWLKGNCDEAIAIWKRAYSRGDLSAAFELFRIGEYQNFSPDIRLALADYSYAYGDALVNNRDEREAYQWYRRSLDIFPRHNVARALVRLPQISKDTQAIAQIWQGIADSLPNTNPEYWWAIAELATLRRDWSSASLAYSHGASLSSEPYEFWLFAGRSWGNALNLTQAIEAYEYALQAKPEDMTSYLGLGHIYRTNRQYAEALRWYAKAKEQGPNVADPYFYLGETYYLMGDYVLARQNIEQSLIIEPNHLVSTYYLAQIEYRQGNFKLSESLLTKAINLEPDPQSLKSWWILLGDWRLEQSSCSGSQDAYKRAQDLGIDDKAVQEKLKKWANVCVP